MKSGNSIFLQSMLILTSILMLNSAAIAHEKVVVIPLMGKKQKIPNNTSPCTPDIAGTLRWTGEHFEGCNGTYWGRLGFTANVPVVFSEGRYWMDRNLGAVRAAVLLKDPGAYGDLYQWGRLTDGHEKRTSSATSTQSSSDVPGHSNFIYLEDITAPFDWRQPQNSALWQGVDGINNPCPSGFRLPTSVEWDNERLSWMTNNSQGAYDSPLKLVASGFRDCKMGDSISSEGSLGYYWSSTVVGISSDFLRISSSSASVSSAERAYGHSVRCIKD